MTRVPLPWGELRELELQLYVSASVHQTGLIVCRSIGRSTSRPAHRHVHVKQLVIPPSMIQHPASKSVICFYAPIPICQLLIVEYWVPGHINPDPYKACLVVPTSPNPVPPESFHYKRSTPQSNSIYQETKKAKKRANKSHARSAPVSPVHLCSSSHLCSSHLSLQSLPRSLYLMNLAFQNVG